MPSVTHVVGNSASTSSGYPRTQIGQSLTVIPGISRGNHPQSPNGGHLEGLEDARLYPSLDRADLLTGSPIVRICLAFRAATSLAKRSRTILMWAARGITVTDP